MTNKKPYKYLRIFLILLMLSNSKIFAQIENVPITNPIYDFLLRLETKGLLPNYSLSQIPWQKNKIVAALELAKKNQNKLSNSEKKTLENFEKEFEITTVNRAVLFYSETDSIQVLSEKILSDYEKNFYHYSNKNPEKSDTVNKNSDKLNENNAKPITNVTVTPLAAIETINDFQNHKNLLLGTLGIRLFGTLSDNFGYYLQITNSAVLKGDSSLALLDKKYSNNIKFTKYGSDADFSESHIAYQNGWFYASLGRETRLSGAGLNQKLMINDLSPAFDAITVAAKFQTFEYNFSHNSVLALPIENEIGTNSEVGVNAIIPNKYVAIHNFIFKPQWGEISFFESIIYTRDLDLAYLNPLSFFKSLEHAQHDRDNAGMGLTAVFRPFANFQLKGTWFLDDIKLSEIGKNYWSNKTAWNVAAITSAIKNLDVGIEYSRVEPYTFSHFNPQNSNTNDAILFGSYILPNSERWNLLLQYWFGERYPIKLNFYYTRHGQNIYDSEGNLIRNVGGDPLYSLTYSAAAVSDDRVEFLDGNLLETFNAELTFGYEFIRNFNVQFSYNLQNENDIFSSYFKLMLRFSDF